MFFLNLKDFKDKSTTTFGSLFCQALWNKEPKRKRPKKEKRCKGKALGGVLGPHLPPYLAIFFFPIGDKWKIQEKEADDNAFVLGMVTSKLVANSHLIIVELIL
jgi:hypothetical protein